MPLTYRRRPGPPAEGGRGLVRVDGSTVALDEPLLRLLKAADGCTLDQILAAPTADFPTPLATRAAVACLVEARLLERHPMNEREEEKSPSTPPVLVSAVIVAWNGVHWLKALLPSLLKQTHDPIEIIVVDNGSTDETYGWVQRAYPDIRVLSLCPERSLAGAINAGVDEAQGDHFLVLNQDVRLKPTAVEELVRVAEADEQCAGVAANLRLLSAPAFLNGLGNQVGDSSWGTDNAMGHLDLGQFDAWKEVPSACFAAILIPANAWEQVGPADEAYPLYYEDIDWCYRARARGLRIRVAPRAVVLHAFGASTTDGETEDLPATKLERVVHGRLRFALKLLAGPEAKVFVRNYLREDLRGLRRALRAGCYREALAYPAGWGRAITDLPRLVADRRRLGACRASPAAILRDLPQDIPAARLQGQHPLLTSRDVMRDYGPRMRQAKTRPIPELGGRRRPVLLIVSQDVVDHRMAGPGLRYVEMARALARDVDPVLAIPNKTSLEVPGVHLVSYDELKPDSLQVLVDNADAAVVSGYMLKKFPFLRRTATRLVVDLYDPIVLENLHF